MDTVTVLDVNEPEPYDDDLSLACLMIAEDEREVPLLKLGPGGDHVDVRYAKDFA